MRLAFPQVSASGTPTNAVQRADKAQRFPRSDCKCAGQGDSVTLCVIVCVTGAVTMGVTPSVTPPVTMGVTPRERSVRRQRGAVNAEVKLVICERVLGAHMGVSGR
ncbi:hypothetical protein NJBCHELONAE_01970 [Mycobacteroides chelonae]|nr:hypothetical protein NJBCHELONAE_01970 [Mycobacteroides chelonae]